MELKLSDEEIRRALAKALAEKVSYTLGEFDPEECWFEVTSPYGVVEDIESIKFCYKVGT